MLCDTISEKMIVYRKKDWRWASLLLVSFIQLTEMPLNATYTVA